MILNTEVVEQVIDREERGRFVKDTIVARGPESIGLVRRRSLDVDGSRGTLLLIHGYGQNRYAWHLPGRSFANRLAQSGYDVYTMDVRGQGRSGYYSARRPRNAAEYVREDVPTAVEEIQRISGTKPIWLVGHSLGGLVAYAAAPALAGAVAGIATFGSPYMFTAGAPGLALLGHLLLFADAHVMPSRGWLPLHLWGETLRVAKAFVESPVFPLPLRGFAPGSMEPNVYAQHMALAMERANLEVMASMFRYTFARRSKGINAGGLEGFEGTFEKLDLPLLVVAGTKDDLASPAAVKPAYENSRSTDKTYRVFPSGHIDLLVGKSAPSTSWAALEAWLSKRTRAVAA